MSDDLSDVLLKLIHDVVKLMPREAYSDDSMYEIGKIIDSTTHGHSQIKLASIQKIAAEKITATNPNSFFGNKIHRFYHALHRMDERNIIPALEGLKNELQNRIEIIPHHRPKNK